MHNGTSGEAMMPTQPHRSRAHLDDIEESNGFDKTLYDGVRTSMDVLRTNIRNLAIVAVTLNASTIGVYVGLSTYVKTHAELLALRQMWPVIGMAIVLVFMGVYRQRFQELGQYIYEGYGMEKLRKSPHKGACELAIANHRYGPGTYLKPASADSAAIMSGIVWTLAMIFELKGF